MSTDMPRPAADWAREWMRTDFPGCTLDHVAELIAAARREGEQIMRARAADCAAVRHVAWDEDDDCAVCDDISACQDIAAAILALPLSGATD